MYSKLLLEKADADRERILKLAKSNNFILCITLAMAIATELNDIGRFDRGAKLAYVWRILVNDWPDAKRLFDHRYKALVKRQLRF
jgi:hypothetical protein